MPPSVGSLQVLSQSKDVLIRLIGDSELTTGVNVVVWLSVLEKPPLPFLPPTNQQVCPYWVSPETKKGPDISELPTDHG